MGSGSWSASSWGNYAAQNVNTKTQSQMFSSSRLNEAVDPLKFTNGIRESVDGPDHPHSTPVAIFSDMTGSMGILAETIVRNLDVVCQELLDRKPVSDPHLLTGVFGDAYSDGLDGAPIQATQFESDIRIAEQTQKLYLRRGGGGNGGESAALVWLLMGSMTAIDSYDKRNKRGYLITLSDEPVHGAEGSNQGEKWGVTKEQAKQFLGLNIERNYTADECLALAQRKFNCFHIVVNPNSGYREGVMRSYGKLMPDNMLFLEDVSVLAQTIVSLIEVNEGRDAKTVAASWGDGKSMVVAKALNGLAVQNDQRDVVVL